MIPRHLKLAAAALLVATGWSAQAANCPRTSIDPATIAATATVGASYSQFFTATNTNASPFTWSITSGLPLSTGFSIKATTGEITGLPTQVGSYLFTVTATDATGCSGGRSYQLAVGQGSQTIAFTSTAPANAQIGGTYEAAANATSNLPVTLSIDASAAGICSIAGSTVTFNAVGNCVIDANQAGDANWQAAPQAQQTVGVGKVDQTVSFTSTAPAGAVVGGAAYGVAATATSGLAVTFSIDASAASVCAIAGSSVTFTGAGTCVVDANQPGNGTYNAAPQAQQSFAVGKGSQTITVTSAAPAAATVGGAPYTVAATAGSGLAVTFAIDPASSGVCAIAGNAVTFQGVGTCTVNANQAGDANWNPAPQAQQSFAVGKGNQTIAFASTPPASPTVGSAIYVAGALASSSLPVFLSIDPSASSVCSILANAVSFIGAGTCIVNANQPGDANWNAAPQVQQSFAVGKGDQTVSFTSTAPTDAVMGGPTYLVMGTASSGLPVTFTIDPSSTACTIAADTVSFVHSGICAILANQPGDANWNAAPQAQQQFTVGKAGQTITFTSTAPTDAYVGGPPYDVAATATSGLAVTFSIDASASGICTIAGSTVSFVAAGTCVVNADQAGDADWNAAARVQQSVEVAATPPCLSPATGDVVNGAMPGNATFCIANTSASSQEYTYLPINNSTTAEITLSLTATGITAVTGPPSPRPAGDNAGLAPLADLPASDEAEDIHAQIDTSPFPDGKIDRTKLIGTKTARPNTIPPGPLVVGQLIDLNGDVSGACSAAPNVRKGKVMAITTPQHAGQQVLYAVQEVTESSPGAGDWSNPVPGGFATIDYQNIIDAVVQAPPGSTPGGSGTTPSSLTKTGGMDLINDNFGAITDLDSNGGVIIFFSSTVNATSPPASSVVLLGTFLARDLFSSAPTSCPSSNEGEIIYMMEPDPTGAINSNVRTYSSVYGTAPGTIIHHLQHLDNAARHIYTNSASALEERWLDEALSRIASELTFYNTSVGLTPRQNIVVTNLTTGPNASVRVAAFNTYANPMYGGLRAYFMQIPGSNGGRRGGPFRTQQYGTGTFPLSHDALLLGYDTTWAFLRYAMDRKNTGDAAFLAALMNNATLTGRANLQAALGAVNLDDWGRDFLVAMYTDDALTSGVLPQYTNPSWNYRSLYTALNGSYQLGVNPLTDGVAGVFPLGPGGSTRYTRFAVPAGGTATMTVTQGGAAPPATVTSALVRTK